MADSRAAAPAEHPGRLPELRAAREAAGRHPPDGRHASSKGASRTSIASRVIVEHSGADHLIFKHAIATIRTPRADAATTTRRTISLTCATSVVPPIRASSSSCSTASASASCPTPRAYGDEGSNTLGNIARAGAAAAPDARGARPRRASSPLGGSAPRRVAARRRSAAWRRRSPGKDSVTGHWELMGIVLDRAVPDVSRTGFPRDADRASSSGASAARTLGNVVASGTAIIDELGAEHMRDRLADRLHVGRQRLPDRRARGRRPGARAVPHAARSPTSWSVEGMGVGRVIARPFVGAPGAFTRTANRHDYALPPLGRHAARPR